MKQSLRKLWFLLHRARFERDLDEEIRHHLALVAEQRGVEAARRQFGNVTSLKEQSRAMWTWTLWEQFAQDIRYGVRTMVANPVFTTIATLLLGLGIGANTAIYSFMDTIMMRALPVLHPEELRCVLGWLCPGVEGIADRPDGSPAARIDSSQLSSAYRAGHSCQAPKRPSCC